MQTQTLPTSGGTAEHTSNNFDFLRFMFAAFVIFSHSFVLTGSGEDPLSLLTRRQVYLGEISVDGFFAISGFLITASWLRGRKVLNFLQKRVLRIYPGFLVVCLFCAFIIGPLGADSAVRYFSEFSTFSFIRHALLLDKLELPPSFQHNPVPNQVNGSLWTIKIEFECYFLVALMGIVGAFRRRIVPLVLLVLGSIAFSVYALQPSAVSHFPETVSQHLRFFNYFLAGMVFFLYRDRIAYRPPLLIGAILLLIVAAQLNKLQAFMALPLVYLLMYAAFSASRAVSGFGRKRDLSYGLYLYAWPVQQMLAAHFRGAFAPYSLFLAAFPLTLMCAWISWYFVEKPSLSLKPKPQKQEARGISVVMPSGELLQ